MHLLGTVLQGLGDELERTDHGLQFTVTAEEQFKSLISIATQRVDANVGRTHILDADIGAAAVTTVATLESVGACFDFQDIGTINFSGVGGDFLTVHSSGSFSYCKHGVPPHRFQ